MTISNNPVPRWWTDAGWKPIPLDATGHPTPDWLTAVAGVPVVSSRLVEETHRSLDGSSRYIQRYRVDQFDPSVNPFSSRVCLFYRETRGQFGFLPLPSPQ